ncbi:hydroxymethylpyrimidine/phosphomethylpyrimidine kinase [Methylomarinovum caldicuralii]|uniref:hydroxymethylpyrimidine kinase n=1 Tax=Methylomarinovum caldicuralii TaxID=438856 RepID=A0AAU9CT83_9GAMM|nr:bifunctional hydroxymethylpyrimidine kinase/phosphomethylpyrimidine kinase [Methylomarinovum caldicuralii]BCX82707.1 hydroxymethylpyrimidine/phosphomethylpyrimidine kinase [Methylomarinovum caldicuralii]
MKPTVLAISGHDPTGGAGIQADIEAIASQGCHPATLVTCLTAQDTRNVYRLYPQSPTALAEQWQHLTADIHFDAVKIGLLGSAEIAALVADRLRGAPAVTVLDPILKAGGGSELADEALIDVLLGELVPLATVLTPNLDEARRLTGETLPSRCAEALLARGCQAVLITGGDEPTPLIYNTLYLPGSHKTFTWEKLPASAHGSGCTLAAALAALLARGLELEEAARKAQQYTWNAIKYGFRLGQGQPIPERLFWS